MPLLFLLLLRLWKSGKGAITILRKLERGGEGEALKSFRRTYGLAAAAVVLGGTLSLSPSWLLSPILQYYVNKSPSFAVARHKSTICQANAERADIFFPFRPNFPFFHVISGPFSMGRENKFCRGEQSRRRKGLEICETLN